MLIVWVGLFICVAGHVSVGGWACLFVWVGMLIVWVGLFICVAGHVNCVGGPVYLCGWAC